MMLPSRRRSHLKVSLAIVIAIGCASSAPKPKVASAGCDIGCDESSIVTVYPPGAPGIPSFQSEVITGRDSGELLAALVGTVVDSVTGRALEGASVVVRPRGTSDNRIGSFVDSHGGFVIRRVKPGPYQMLVRRIGFDAFTQDWDATQGKIDTARFRLRQASPFGYRPSVEKTARESAGRSEPMRAISTCLPADSGGTDALYGYRLVDTTDVVSRQKWRTNLGLAQVSVNEISLVSDERICRKAFDAFREEFRGHDKILDMKAVYVIKYGRDRFIIGNPNGPHGGEWRLELVSDQRFRTITLAGR
jgi:hypothetical protein